eukprot:CFRG6890T1
MSLNPLGVPVADADTPGEYAVFSPVERYSDEDVDEHTKQLSLNDYGPLTEHTQTTNNGSTSTHDNMNSNKDDLIGGSRIACKGSMGDHETVYVWIGDMRENKSYLNTYVDYLVEVREESPTADPVVCCRRRYSDFEWLRTVLVRVRPYHIIPALPGKTLIQVGEEKLEVRRMGFVTFLHHILNHPDLCVEECVDQFLHKPPNEWSRASDFQRPVIQIGHPKGVDLEYARALERSSHTVLQMESLYRLQQKAGYKRYDVIKANTQTIKDMQTMSEAEHSLKPLLDMVCKQYEQSNEIDTEFMKSEMVEVLGPIQDLSGYARSAQRVLTYRNDVQFDCEYYDKKLENAKLDRDAVQNGERRPMTVARMFGKSAAVIKEEELASLDKSIKELRQKRDEKRNDLRETNKTVTNELMTWERTKDRVAREMIEARKSLNIKRLEKQIESTRSFVDILKTNEQPPLMTRNEFIMQYFGSNVDPVYEQPLSDLDFLAEDADTTISSGSDNDE